MAERTVAGVRCIETEAKSVINRVAGMGFGWSINPYRGCFHACVFCYARETHAFLERDGVREWGTVLSVKTNAPAVLRRELARPSWRGERIMIGTATDPYQPVERHYRVTRGILEELARARTPASITTRSPLVERDADVLQSLARAAGASVCVSLPTLDAELARRIEPTVASPARRLETIRRLAAAGVRVGVAIAPILPGLTSEPDGLRATFAAAVDAGASFGFHSALRLTEIPRERYFAFLAAEYPALLERHERWYRPGVARAAISAGIESGARAAIAGIELAPDRSIATAPARVQLSLLDAPSQPLAQR